MRKFFFLLSSFLLLGMMAGAQQTISGKVSDSNGLPLAGVTVKSKKTGKGTESAADGSFRLSVLADDQLVISSVGYKTQTIRASNPTIAIVLEQAIEELSQVVLVGSRRAGRVKTETTAPVDVINVGQATAPTARMDLSSILNYAAPSFNYNKQSGSDGADHIDLATLRGLGPDQTLVLVNGKRRHQTAFVAVFGTRGRGNAGTDLNAIPASAIDRVEILRDGASAQYGSDAIAGVINLITKKNIKELTGSVALAGYHDPKFNTAYADDLHTQYEHSGKIDGASLAANLNFGLPLGKKGGFVNLTFDAINTNKTFRQAIDTSNYYTNDDAMYINIYRRGHGDAGLEMFGTFLNMELPVSKTAAFYAFGGYNHKSSDAYAFTRNFSARPDRFPTDNMGNLIPVPSIMRMSNDGETWYSPHIQTKIKDYSATGGFKGKTGSNWNWDLSNTLGKNDFHFYGDKTFNASLGAGQTHFDDGGFSFLQNTSNLNLSKEFSKKFNLGVGAEFRYENYKIFAGEPNSYLNLNPSKQVTNANGDVFNVAGGSQGFPGYQPNDVVNAKRNVLGLYADAEIDVTDAWLINLAARAENYSDFGFTHNYKFATRYKASKKVNLRASLSTGFRAPSLQQINFSSTFTTVQAGNIAEVKIAPNYSSLAKAAGIAELTQEKSVNANIGFTWRATQHLSVTVDGYMTKIKDRVVLSGQFDGSDPNLDAGLRTQMAALNVSLAQFFANAVNTTNSGIDIVLDYNKTVGNNRFKALFAGNFQTMDIDKINIPAKLSGSTFLKQTFLSDREQKFILASAPNTKFTLNFEYGRKKLTVGTRFTYFGKVTLLGYGQDGLGISPTVPLDNGSGDVPDQFDYNGKLVTDLYFSYPINKKITAYAGADNLFNNHPDFGVVKGAKDWAYNTETGGAWDAVQMGTNGRRLFLRLAFNF
ncbi:MAG: TonB-dependent receptor [Bacteroidota bacterium]|nr:TonB-dependent receptor [Bacteroidota bacterium]